MGLRHKLTDPDIGRHLLRDEGEVIVDEVRRHWVVYLGPILIGALGLAFLGLFGSQIVRLITGRKQAD